MSRTVLMALLLCIVVVMGGCSGITGQPSDQSTPPSVTSTDSPQTTTPTPTPEDREGYIAAYLVKDVPDDAPVVNLSNESFDSAPMVQQVVTDTANSGENTTLTLTGDEIARAQEALWSVPEYSASGYPAGHYIRHNGTTVAVHVAVDE